MVSTDMTRLPQVTAEVLLALDERRERDGVTLAEIARAVARRPSSVQRALAAMLRDGVVTAYVTDRPVYRLAESAPVAALIEVARWSRQLPMPRRRASRAG
jgi:predicted transcriptional regulator